MDAAPFNKINRAEFIEIARRMIAFDTTPQSSTFELVKYLENVATEMGLVVEVLNESLHGQVQSNIIVRTESFGAQEPTFLLQSHLDTVDAGAFQLWKKNGFNPFDAVIENDLIYGLGAADVKLDFLCKLYALTYFKNEKFSSLKPIVVGTFGEEFGMQGALKLFRKNKINAKYAILSEASNLSLINAAKGFLTVEIRIPLQPEEQEFRSQRELDESLATETKIFSGRSAHSSTPHLGENAAKKLLEYLQNLSDRYRILDIDAGSRFNTIPHQAMVEIVSDENYKEKNSTLNKIKNVFLMMQEIESDMKFFVDEEFEPQHSTLSVGVIRQFEDHILIGGSCRIVPSVRNDIYEKWIHKFQNSCEKIGVEFHLQDYKKPFRTPEKSVLLKTSQGELEKMGLDTAFSTMASTNEASLFSRMGIECVCWGPGKREGNIHTPQEHVSLNDLDRAIEFYGRMIQRLCL